MKELSLSIDTIYKGALIEIQVFSSSKERCSELVELEELIIPDYSSQIGLID